MSDQRQADEVLDAVLTDLVQEHPLPKIRTGVKAGTFRLEAEDVMVTIKFRNGKVKRA